MKKNIYGNLLLVFIFIGATNVKGDDNTKIKFSYDPSGNQIRRENVINMSAPAPSSSNMKSSGSQATETASAEIQKFEDSVDEMKITIYPNPTKGMLRVDVSGRKIPADAKIIIYNVSGAVILRLNGVSESNMVDISEQPAGAYIMKISLGTEQISSWKIIKE